MAQRQLRAASRGVLALFSVAALALSLAGCDPVVPVENQPQTPPPAVSPAAGGSPAAAAAGVKPFDKSDFKGSGKVVKTASGLKYEDMTPGTGTPAKAGDQVGVWYTGTLENGTKFDSSRDRNEPFKFALGAGQVIKGWDEGVAGMKVGGRRKLTIPPDLGYGAGGQGPIPANSTLIFDVEVASIEPAGK